MIGVQAGTIRAGRDVNLNTFVQGFSIDEMLQLVALARSTEAKAHVELTRCLQERSFGISDAAASALANFFEIVGAQDEPPDHWPRLLQEIAHRHVDLLSGLSKPGDDAPSVMDRRRRAAEAIKFGDYDLAEKLLAEADKIDAKAISEQRDVLTKRKRSRTMTLSRLGELAMTRLNYRAAAGYFRKAAENVGQTPELRDIFFQMAESEADAWHRLGKEYGDNDALEYAIRLLRWILSHTDRKLNPTRWIAIHNGLGSALETSGTREGNTAKLQESVTVYRESLKVCTRKRLPGQWAMIQNNLGNVLTEIGLRERDMRRFKEAVSAYRRSSKQFELNQDSHRWGVAQTGLGSVLQTWGSLEEGTIRVEASVVAFRGALSVCRRSRQPLHWARIQNNMGNSLQILGKREMSPKRLKEAVKAYRNALEEWTRRRAPLDWQQLKTISLEH